MKFDFRIIPHRRQRYDSPGDYFRRNGVVCFRVSRMKTPLYMWLVYLHEVIEWTITYVAKVKTRDIDKFDMEYERTRSRTLDRYSAPCGCHHYDEPGDDPHAPYHEAHQVATACERLIAKALGVDWTKYEEAVGKL